MPVGSILRSWDKFRFRLRRHFVQVLRSKHSERSIGMGFALGTFAAALPTPGFSVFIGILFIAMFKRINKLAVFTAIALWNPFTLIPVYWLSTVIGESIYATDPAINFRFEMLNQVYQFTRRFLVGNLILSVPLTITCYYLAIVVIRKFRAERK